MLSLNRILALTLVTTALAACGDPQPGDEADTSSTTTDTDAASTGPTTGAVDPACACIDPAQFGRASYTCAPGPCDSVAVECDAEGSPSDTVCGSGTVVSLDEVALNCALDQLIAGTPGLIEYSISDYISSGGAFVAIGPGGDLMRSYGVYDLGGSEGAVGPVSLKDAAYFTACKAEPDVQARFLCFIRWTDDEPAATCDDASELSSEF